MTSNLIEKRAAFRALHKEGCFVLPNPWDAGSARMLQQMGFVALASTSTGFAWTKGRPDYSLDRDEVLQHLRLLCDSVDLPINADFESGFGAEPEVVAHNVDLAVRTGVAGISIEDRKLGEASGLYDKAFAVERMRAAHASIIESGSDVILVARTEGLLDDPKAINPAIDKLVAFADAGADCLFAPGVRERADITAMVRALAPKPVNVLVMGPGVSVKELADLGVRRISIGGALAQVSWAAVLAAAEKIKAGLFDALASGVSGSQLNSMFSGFTQKATTNHS
jgi:2-methylisocitrate lyase-like PEP mutase family enzyme